MPKQCEVHSGHNKYDEAMKTAHYLNLTVPDGQPKWVVSETIKGVRWNVVRFD